MTKTIVITSGKGGVGKSNISVNLAAELARRQYRTCLLDADLGLANVNILLGIHPENTLDDVILRGVPLAEIIVPTEHGVDVVPGSSGVETMANLEPAQLSGLVEGFGGLSRYDYFLIDTSSGISRGVISFCLAASETVLVLTAEATSLADAYAVLKVLSLNNYRGTVKVLVNKCAGISQAKKTYLHFKSVADKHLRIEVAPGGAVLFDPLLGKAVSLQQPVTTLFPDSVFAQCIRALVSNLVRTEPAEAGGDSFWSRYAAFVRSDLQLPGVAKRQIAEQAVATPASDPSSADRALPEPAGEPVRLPVPDSALPVDGLLFTAFRLPSPAPLLASLLEMMGSGTLSLERMQEVIAHDPALLAKVLQLHQPGRLLSDNRRVDIGQAVADLGEETVSRLLLTASSHDLLLADSVQEYRAVNGFWAHSRGCGLMAEALGELIAYPFAEEPFLAGMLHDIGRLALLQCRPGLYAADACTAHSEEILAAERAAAGRTHAELGAEMLADWGLGSLVVDAVRYHAETEERIETALDLAKLVYLAHRLCSSSDGETARAVQLTKQFFGLSESQIFTCMQTVGEEQSRTASTYNIPCGRTVKDLEAAETLREFRRRAVEFVTLQGLAPRPQAVRTIPDGVRSIIQGLNVLFGISRVFCLLPEPRGIYLQAAGCPGCYGFELADNISFSLTSRESLVVAAYRSARYGVYTRDDLRAMADRQLLRLMQAEVLVCLPLTGAGATLGLVVCGTSGSAAQQLRLLRSKLEMFVAQVAAGIAELTR